MTWNKFTYIFITLTLCSCLESPGTKTGNPDSEPINHYPSPITTALSALAQTICQVRSSCFGIATASCADELMATENAANVFTTNLQKSTWFELEQSYLDNEVDFDQTATNQCFSQIDLLSCDDPNLDASLNQSDFSQIDQFFNSVQVCRNILTTNIPTATGEFE